MLKLLLILCVVICYFSLQGGITNYSYWLGGAFAIVTITVFIVSLAIERNEIESKLQSSRATTRIDYLIATFSTLLLICLIYLTTSLAPKHIHILYRHTPSLNSSLTNDNHQDSSIGYTENTLTGSEPWSEAGNTLSSTGGLKSSNYPEIFIETATKQEAEILNSSPIYIRDYSNSRFDGQRWKSTRKGHSILESVNNEPIRIHPSNNSNNTGIRHTVYRSYHPDQANTLASLQGIQEVSGLDRVTKASSGVFLLPPPTEGETAYSYTACSYPVNFNDLKETLESGNIYPAYLKPSSNKNLSTVIRQYAKQFENRSSLVETLIDLRSHLQKTCLYSLENSQLSKETPIEDFLHDSKAGYCLHFATATSLIVRELGVPSRITYGWTGGKYYPLNNQFVFLAKEAHAWCEIYLKKHGWVIFDTTPPESTPRASATAKEEEEPPQLTQEPIQKGYNETNDLKQEQRPNTSWALIISLILTLSTITFLLLAMRSKRPANNNQTLNPIQKKKHNYLTLFQIQCAKHGYPLRTGRTIRKQIQLLNKAGLYQTFFDDFLNYHYGLTYEKRVPDLAKEDWLTEQIQQWKPKE